MDYYLYSHSNADGIFYIGKGCGNRKDDYYRMRSNEWRAIASKGYTTKIEANGTEQDILSLERIVVKSLVEQGVKLVNKHLNPNWRHSEETNRKKADAVRGENNPMFGKKHSDEAKQKISNATKGENNPMFGKKNPALGYALKKRWQHYKLNKANNYRRQNEI